MRRSGRDVALGLVTAVAVGLLTFAARGAVLPVVDRALDGVTLLRVLIALAALAVLRIVAALWHPGGDPLPEWELSARKASIALGGVVGLAAGVWSALNERVTVPTVFADEFIYISLAKGLSRGDGPVVRGVETLGYGIAYPVFLAPVYALAGDGADAFTAAQVANAAVMASAAVPTYLLARTILSRSDALLAATFAVATPLLAYSGYVLTESLFYPAFLWTAYAIVRALTTPSPALQVVALGALVGLCTVRPQAVVLVPAAATAVGLVSLASRGEAERLRRYRLLLGGLAGVALVAGAVRLLADTSPVGAYDVLVTWPDPVELATWAGRELAGLALATGLVAGVAFLLTVLLMLGRSASVPERALGATSLAFAAWMLASVAVLDASSYGLGYTHLRNLVGVIPLVVLVGIVWARRGMPRPPVPAILGAGVVLFSAFVVRSADLERFARHDAPEFLAWRPFASQALPLDRLFLLCVAVAVVVALTTRVQWALAVSVLAGFLVVMPQLAPQDPPWGVERASMQRLAALDRAVSPRGDALVITAGLPDEGCETHPLALTALWTEVLNISAGAGRLFGDDLIGSVARFTIASDGTLLDAGVPVTADAVAIDERVDLEGVPFATVALRDVAGEFADDPGGLRFWRTDGRVRVTNGDRVRRLASRECPET